MPIDPTLWRMGLDASGQRTVPVPPNGSDEWFDWVSPSNAGSWLKDSGDVPVGSGLERKAKAPILHWFEFIGQRRTSLSTLAASQTQWVVKNQNVPHPQLNDVIHLQEMGDRFEEHVINAVLATGLNCITIAQGGASARDESLVHATVQAIHDGYDVIIQGVLWEPTHRTYGICDMIVRSDRLGTLFDALKSDIESGGEAIIDPFWKHDFDDVNLPSPVLEYPDDVAPYHYRVIDVKLATVSVKKNGELAAAHNHHAGQLEIYTRCLENILQMNNIPEAYLLGKKVKWTGGQTATCFSRMGIHRKREALWLQILQLVDWRRNIRNAALTSSGDLAQGWNPLDVSTVIPELHGFHGLDKANDWSEANKHWVMQTRDVSQLPDVDLAERHRLWNLGRSEVNIDTLTPANLQQNVVQQNVVALAQNGNFSIPSPGTAIVCSNTDTHNALQPAPATTVEFFVDFEFFTGDHDYDFNRFPHAASSLTDFIFLIGCSHWDANGNVVYRRFLTMDRTAAEEARILAEWARHMQTVQASLGASDSRCFVWHKSAENTALNFASSRGAAKIQPNLVDLKLAFGNSLTLRGMRGTGLKEITRILSQLPTSGVQSYVANSVQHGMAAMMVGFRAWKDGMSNGGTMANPTEPDPADPYLVQAFQDSLVYNERDCVVMMEILDYLRANHV